MFLDDDTDDGESVIALFVYWKTREFISATLDACMNVDLFKPYSIIIVRVIKHKTNIYIYIVDQWWTKLVLYYYCVYVFHYT